MKKLGLMLGMICFFSICYADSLQDFRNSAQASGNPSLSLNNPYEKDYLPQPGEGIKIIPFERMHHNDAEVNEIRSFQDEYKQYGFVKRKSYDAIKLLSVNKNHFITNEQNTYFDLDDPYDSHVKQKVTQIKLAFDYHPISFISQSNVLGFAVADTWIKKPREGWTGIIEIFTDSNLGTCDYQKSNVKLATSSVYLTQESVSYRVNGKPTVDLVEGDDKSGYAYKVNWYDSDYYHILKCALKMYDPGELKKVIALANKIDLD